MNLKKITKASLLTAAVAAGVGYGVNRTFFEPSYGVAVKQDISTDKVQVYQAPVNLRTYTIGDDGQLVRGTNAATYDREALYNTAEVIVERPNSSSVDIICFVESYSNSQTTKKWTVTSVDFQIRGTSGAPRQIKNPTDAEEKACINELETIIGVDK